MDLQVIEAYDHVPKPLSRRSVDTCVLRHRPHSSRWVLVGLSITSRQIDRYDRRALVVELLYIATLELRVRVVMSCSH